MDGLDGKRSGWSVEQSAELYQVKGWGEPYFRINARGRIDVYPDPQMERGIDLYDLALALQERGIDLPMLVRFPNILNHRVRLLNECFARAIAEYNYSGDYRGVFPIKVNQQRHIIENLVEAGRKWRYGLEAGSKPELLIALAAMDDDDGFILCNGYKDDAFIETALIAHRFDNTVVIILERIDELDLVFRASEKLGIRPCLGVRAKLSSKGIGKWADSCGERAKFGLTTSEIIEVIDRLTERGMLDSLSLLHFHMGSQISSIIPVKNAIREAGQMYVDMVRMGCNMRYLDVGGGLAVDYDGSKTDFHASMNYDIQEYAYDIVAGIQDACEKASVPSPTIVTESGRAVAAHQSVLLVDVLGADEVRFGTPDPVEKGSHRIIEELYDTWKGIVPKNVQEAWHDALQAKEEARSLFKFGYLSLRELARAEKLFWNCCEKIQQCVQRLNHVPEELVTLGELMSSIYYCNFSIFQSAPDTWAMDQVFPVMPIHRLDEEPTVRARLADVTCDSDGMIDHFIDVEEIQRVLPLHPLRRRDPYILGMFLGGAYQEILGDLHNLFGDTNAVHVRLEEYGYSVEHVIKGDSIHDVLRYVQHDPEAMVERVRVQAERALNAGNMTLQQLRTFMRHYEESLRGYTYLKSTSHSEDSDGSGGSSSGNGGG